MGRNRVGLGLDTSLPLAEIAKWAKLADGGSIDSLWVSEDPYFRDSVSTLSMVSTLTKRVTVSGSILNMFSRNPVYMAMVAGTLDELSGGRFILGLGRGIRSVMEDELHVKYGSHLVYAQEYVDCVRRLLDGERITMEGKEVSLTGAKLRFPLRKGSVPILVAAMGRKMLRVAASHASGAILNCCTSARHARLALETMNEASRSEHRMACYLWTNIDDDQDRAYEFARTRVGYILSVPTFGETFLESSGLRSDFLPELRKAYKWDQDVGDPIWHLEQGDPGVVRGLVSDEIVDALSICGPVEHCRKRIEEYADAGVTDSIIGPMNTQTYEKAHLLTV